MQRQGEALFVTERCGSALLVHLGHLSKLVRDNCFAPDAKLHRTPESRTFVAGADGRLKRSPGNVIVMGALTAGCNGGEEGDDVPNGPRSVEPGPGAARAAEATSQTRCEVGERPNYFVPGGNDGPFAIIGCARLGVSGKAVEFSADDERIGRKDHVCLDPAYRGRGELGNYIPAVCVRDPVSRKPEVISVEIPRQAVRGYQLVMWGSVAP